MSEEKDTSLKEAADATKAILDAVPVYQDAIQPAAQEVGKSLEIVAKTVRVALSPLSALVWGYEHISEYLDSRITERFKNIPPERIQTPKASIAGPTVESMRFVAQDPDLREMYAKLLGTAMDSAVSTLAHPAFVETIRQLCLDEAKILSLIANSRYQPIPVVFLMAEMMPPDFTGGGHLTLHRNVSVVAEHAECESEDLCSVYLDNLVRLGLAEIKAGRCGDTEAVDLLYDSAKEKSHISEQQQSLRNYVQDYSLRATDFGQQFFDACILEPEQ